MKKVLSELSFAAPVAPDKNSLLSVNASTAQIYLDAFHDGIHQLYCTNNYFYKKPFS